MPFTGESHNNKRSVEVEKTPVEQQLEFRFREAQKREFEAWLAIWEGKKRILEGIKSLSASDRRKLFFSGSLVVLAWGLKGPQKLVEFIEEAGKELFRRTWKGINKPK